MIDAGTVQYGLKLISDDLGVHDRRLAVDLADAGGVAGLHDAALDRLDEGRRDIHDDIALAEVARVGAQADEVEFELAQAAPRPERSWPSGSRVHRAGAVEPVARLEAAHAGLHVGIVDAAIRPPTGRDRR